MRCLSATPTRGREEANEVFIFTTEDTESPKLLLFSNLEVDALKYGRVLQSSIMNSNGSLVLLR